MPEKRWQLRCPECGAKLTVDAKSGAIVEHRPSRRRTEGRSFEGLFAEMKAEQSQNAERFAQEMDAQGDRDRLLGEKFEEAMRRAEEDPDDKPPPRPFDFD